MPQDDRHERKFGRSTRRRTTVLRAVLAIAVASAVAGLHSGAARAGDDDPDESFISKFARGLGLKRTGVDTSSIDYNERAPLVVPPTRDLPQPGASAPAPVADWPQNPVVKPHKHSRGKAPPATPVPNAAASIADPNAAAQAGQEPEQKSSFTLNWFNKEEYAKFGGEPPRGDLTDPPAGYRTPSPEQPYGIWPDKKQAKGKKAGDGTDVEAAAKPPH